MAMSSQVSPTDLTTAFARLRAVYALAGASGYKDDPQTFTSEWYNVLRSFRRDELAQAVADWVEGDKAYWPKPGELKRLIFERRAVRNVASVERKAEWYHEPTDWFAFPVTPQDTEGPRYRLQLVSLAQAKGLALVEQVECPIEGCHCWAREVKLSPTDHGLSSHFASDRALGVLQNVRPTGWRWAHHITLKKLELV